MKKSDSPEEKHKQWFYTTVGEIIREKRIQCGESQDSLASALKISRVSMTNIENGKQRLPLHLLVDIAYFLNVSISDLTPTQQKQK